MSGGKDLLLDILKLTDEVKRLNKDIDRMGNHVADVDKRVVRLETMVEFAQTFSKKKSWNDVTEQEDKSIMKAALSDPDNLPLTD